MVLTKCVSRIKVSVCVDVVTITAFTCFRVPPVSEPTKSVQLRLGTMCLDTLSRDSQQQTVGLYMCHNAGGNQVGWLDGTCPSALGAH